MTALVDFSQANGAELRGSAGSVPSLNVAFRFGSNWKTVWTSFLDHGPTFDLNFDYLRPAISLDTLEKAAAELLSIEGVAPQYIGVQPGFARRPSVPNDPVLLQTGAIEAVKRALSTVLSQR